MKKTHTLSSMGLFILFAVMLAFASTLMMQKVNAASTETFSTQLTAAAANSTSTATGDATFSVSTNGQSLMYTLNAYNITNVTAAHLHCAIPGKNGPVIVPLYSSGSSTPMNSNGQLASGSITAADILPAAMQCSPNIQTLQHLMQAMREGQIYVNVHTVQNPSGEIRGQIMSGSLMINVSTTTTGVGTTTSSSTSTSSGSSTTSIPIISNPNGLGMYYVSVVPDAYYKTRGQYVTFTGSHFYPNEMVKIQMNGSTVASLAADGTGSFSNVRIMLPYSSGTYAYTFTGVVSGIPYTVNESVGGGNPWVTLNNYYAGPGSQISVMGHSFGSGEAVTVWYDGVNEASASANDNGDFSTTITIPSNGAGRHTISAKGALTGISAFQSFSEAW
jgi:hypothetical protein